LTDSAVTDTGLGPLEKMPRLELLDLSRTRVSGQGLKHVSASKLSKLVLTGTAVADPDLGTIADFRELVELRVGDTAITDAGLSALRSCHRLKILDLSGNRVSGSGLRDLIRVAYLTLRGTEVTDETLPHLLTLRDLVRLDLSDTKVTAQGLSQLRQLPRLRLLELEGVGFKYSEYHSLRRDLSQVVEIRL
jgi:Leucine-rich repeat (LRR) protein